MFQHREQNALSGLLVCLPARSSSPDLSLCASFFAPALLQSMIPLLLRMQQVAEHKARLEGKGKTGDFAKVGTVP